MQYNRSSTLTILGVFSIHKYDEKTQQCSKVDLYEYQHFKIFQYLMEEMNRNLRHLNISYSVFDSCAYSRTDLINQLRQTLHSTNNLQTFDINTEPTPKILSLVGTLPDNLGTDIVDISSPDLPIISTSSRLKKFGDRSRYPNFYKTVSTTLNVAEALLSFLDKNNNTYVKLVYSDTPTMSELASEFLKLTHGTDVCVASLIKLERYYKKASAIENIARYYFTNTYPDATVGVLLLIEDDALRWFSALSSLYKGRPSPYTWLTIDLNYSFRYIYRHYKHITTSSYLLQTDRLVDDDIRRHLRKLNTISIKSQWDIEYFEQIHKCYLSSEGMFRYKSQCINNTSRPPVISPTFQNTIDAVKVLDKALQLHETTSCHDNNTKQCEESLTSTTIEHNLKTVLNFDPERDSTLYFNSLGGVQENLAIFKYDPDTYVKFEKVKSYVWFIYL